MLNTPLTAAAAALARRAHEGQLDKAGEPYINHPLTVAESMDTEEETCVALLHDVIEDSAFNAADLREAGMPDAVVEAVELLTRDESVDYLDYVHTVRENPLAAKVKRADLAHNLDTSRLHRRLTAIDMKRQSRYRAALDILDGKDGATAAPAPSLVPPVPPAPASPHSAPCAQAAVAPHASLQGERA